MMKAATHIRQATSKDILLLAGLIADAYKDVAMRFGLTPQNCPKHPSNCTAQWISNDMDRGVKYFVLVVDGIPAGCAAMEIPQPGACYLERLAVLPQFRQNGFGAELVHRVFAEARTRGVRTVGIGIIGAQHDLKQWYRNLGFAEGETRQFEHLPFDVTFMNCAIGEQ